MRVMEVCILELMDREEVDSAVFVTIRVGQVRCKAATDVPPPRCHTHNSRDDVCWGFCVSVCPSGLPFGNTVKSYCLSSSHSASCSFQHSLFSSPSIPLSHSSFKRGPNLPVTPSPLIRLKNIDHFAFRWGPNFSSDLVFVTAFVSILQPLFLCTHPDRL